MTVNNRAPKTEFLSPNNVERINKLLKSAFKQAVRWGIVEKNPFEDTTLPKVKQAKRDIWDVKTISSALDACRDPKLYVAMNLAFACSMHMGEILGLTWENTHISDADIVQKDTYIVIDKELARVKEETIETLSKDEIIKIFPRTMYLEGQKTRIVFKTPNATYKLKLNYGDLKATQGDTGHAQAQMLKEIYAHILDEDRKVNAQKFEAAFYSNPDLRGVQTPEPPALAGFDLAALVDQLQKSPELREMLVSVLSGQNVGKADSGV